LILRIESGLSRYSIALQAWHMTIRSTPPVELGKTKWTAPRRRRVIGEDYALPANKVQ
jgi:hypothetical protein